MYLISKRKPPSAGTCRIGSNERDHPPLWRQRPEGEAPGVRPHRAPGGRGRHRIQTSRIGSMDYASAGSGFEMDAIAAVIVGGHQHVRRPGVCGGHRLRHPDCGRDEQPPEPHRRVTPSDATAFKGAIINRRRAAAAQREELIPLGGEFPRWRKAGENCAACP